MLPPTGRARNANRCWPATGEITAPCGVPTFVSDQLPSSDTPAFNHFRISRSILGSATRCWTNFSSHSWSRLSKNPRMSASSTQFTLLRSDSHRQRVQRIMLASPRPESVGESQKILFVNLIQDHHHGPLDDFVFQRRDAHRPLPPVGFGDVHPPGGLRPIRAPMHPAVQISQSLRQSGFILLPGHSIDSRRRLPFHSVEAVAQQCLRQVMEQRR